MQPDSKEPCRNLGNSQPGSLAHGGHQPANERVSFHMHAVRAHADVGQDAIERLRQKKDDQRIVAEPIASSSTPAATFTSPIRRVGRHLTRCK
jgi:hypothetical protein